MLIQLTGYIGWPLVLPVARIALDVFDATQGCSSATQANAFAETQARECDRYAPYAPKEIAEITHDIARCLDEPGASTTHLEPIEHAKARHLTAIACLTCLARNADAEALAKHMRDALSLGASRQDIVEAIVGTLPHAGVLAAQSALRAANQLFASTDSHAAGVQETTAA
ncbi:carboxymuconolactone decarboxylase family protein [Burkholderia stabilis]|uniref:carboxymuconolactone decarboxylase family protein n=1 Tax=Burkholderia stabilis TaxID=95485 RepID=UPI00080B0CCA|nr:carboxymuconolactone decarboxylase family protein [Burkholderia stabilis]GAU06592.1 hypothetical protein BSLA_03r0562 [Burkholderia stabilis]